MASEFQLTVKPREGTGTNESRRLRRQGKVPGILYGGERDNLSVVLEHNEILHSIEVAAFHSAVITLKYGEIEQDVVLRKLEMHPWKRQIMHVDLQRVDASQTLRMSVPLHFEGEDKAPGITIDSGIMSHLINDVEIQCLPKDLPEFLTIDCSDLTMNESKHLTDIKLPEGVELVHFISGGEDLAIASISPAKVASEDAADDAAAEEASEAAEGGDETKEEDDS